MESRVKTLGAAVAVALCAALAAGPGLAQKDASAPHGARLNGAKLINLIN
jgi:hypothetical protein